MALGDQVASELKRVVDRLPGGGEVRTGQEEMARRTAESLAAGDHLVIRAGTGTGKTLAYLVPAILLGRRVVVATATKALQDQLATKDLPFLQEHLSRPFSWAILKGRSNYVCHQRLAELREQRSRPGSGSGVNREQLELDGLAEHANRDQLTVIQKWAETTSSGDRAELADEPSDATWAAVSTTSRDCPGVNNCPQGDVCFAQKARDIAAASDVIVVNLHLYGLHLASGGAILPDHAMVVVDEAHVLEDVISATCGIELGPGRVMHVARMAKGLLSDSGGGRVESLAGADQMLSNVLRPHRGTRLPPPLPDEVVTGVAAIREQVAATQAALAALPDSMPESTKARVDRKSVV